MEGELLGGLAEKSPLAGKGKNLSSGQRKILLLARQLSTNAEHYILDESLNFIDQEVSDYIAEVFVDKSYTSFLSKRRYSLAWWIRFGRVG